MMGLSYLRELNARQERKSQRAGVKPFVIYRPVDIEAYPPFPFPFIGERVPRGWKLIDRLFVDSTGYGASTEPALSQTQFKAKLYELEEQAELDGSTLGYGIVEAGRFQLYLGVYLKVGGS